MRREQQQQQSGERRGEETGGGEDEDFSAEIIREAEEQEKRVQKRVSLVYGLVLACAVCIAWAFGGWVVACGLSFALFLVSMFFLPFIRKTLPLFLS